MRAFLVRLPSGTRYWTVLDADLVVVEEADAFLRHVRFGRDCSELTTRSYAGGIALFLRWCARTGRHWHDGVAALGLFITWLRHAGPQASGVDARARHPHRFGTVGTPKILELPDTAWINRPAQDTTEETVTTAA